MANPMALNGRSQSNIWSYNQLNLPIQFWQEFNFQMLIETLSLYYRLDFVVFRHLQIYI